MAALRGPPPAKPPIIAPAPAPAAAPWPVGVSHDSSANAASAPPQTIVTNFLYIFGSFVSALNRASELMFRRPDILTPARDYGARNTFLAPSSTINAPCGTFRQS